MLADREGFIDAFVNGGAEGVDPDRCPIGRNRRNLTERCLKMIRNAEAFDAEFLHDLRHRAEDDLGFRRVWTQSLHLVTTRSAHEHQRTPEMSLNMVGMDRDDLHGLWEFLYARLPYMLLYIVEVATAIIETFATVHPEYDEEMNIRRTAGFLLLACKAGDDAQREIEGGINPTELADCPSCAKPLRYLSVEQLTAMFEDAVLRCDCGWEHSLIKDDEGDAKSAGPEH